MGELSPSTSAGGREEANTAQTRTPAPSRGPRHEALVPLQRLAHSRVGFPLLRCAWWRRPPIACYLLRRLRAPQSDERCKPPGTSWMERAIIFPQVHWKDNDEAVCHPFLYGVSGAAVSSSGGWAERISGCTPWVPRNSGNYGMRAHVASRVSRKATVLGRRGKDGVL